LRRLRARRLKELRVRRRSWPRHVRRRQRHCKGLQQLVVRAKAAVAVTVAAVRGWRRRRGRGRMRVRVRVRCRRRRAVLARLQVCEAAEVQRVRVRALEQSGAVLHSARRRGGRGRGSGRGGRGAEAEAEAEARRAAAAAARAPLLRSSGRQQRASLEQHALDEGARQRGRARV